MSLQKVIINKILNKVDPSVQSYKITFQLATPRSIGCFLLGQYLFMKFIDNNNRKRITQQQKDLSIYSKLLIKRQKSSQLIQTIFSITGVLFSWYSYHQTKSKLWLMGGSFLLAIPLLSRFKISPKLHRLKQIQKYPTKNIKQNINFNESKQKTTEMIDLLQKVNNFINVKILITISSILLFYIAEMSHSQHMRIMIKYNNK